MELKVGAGLKPAPTKPAPLFVAFSLDIDPDANTAVKGRLDALSYPLEKGKAEVEATARGLVETFGVLRELDIPATLFFEARSAQLLAQKLDLAAITQSHEIACHSLRHEDFLGKVSGIPLGKTQSQDIIAESRALLEDLFHKEVVGFRAPYLRVNREVLSALAELGFRYDSSVISDCLRPFCIVNSSPLWEFSVASLRQGLHGRLTSYLIPLFQGRKSPEEYLRSIQTLSAMHHKGVWPALAMNPCGSWLFILAFHPWELFVDHSGRPYPEDTSRELIGRFKKVLVGLREQPSVEFITLQRYLEHYLPKAESGAGTTPEIRG
ncbi:MAG TPA: polysaccharide deacetylase family protein [Candidatus Tripitaka californicus]|uniref:polysaccharide deacetylase family protein n=1 Tax=Candidatus Tripitaka californicus TaxID=3367616 RepID=UPI004026770D